MKIFGKTLNGRNEKSLLWKIKFSKREENISEIEDITNVEFCHGPVIFADDDSISYNCFCITELIAPMFDISS